MVCRDELIISSPLSYGNNGKRYSEIHEAEKFQDEEHGLAQVECEEGAEAWQGFLIYFFLNLLLWLQAYQRTAGFPAIQT